MEYTLSTRVPKAVFFFYFAAAGSLIPFLTLHYQEIGLSGRQIGFIVGTTTLITLFSASLWGALADATKKHHSLLLFAIGGTWLAMLTLSRATTFAWILPVMIVFAIFVAPINPLIDNTIMDLLGEHKSEYGKLRLWGAVGWGLMAFSAGLIIERGGLQWGFYGYLFFMFGLGLTAYHLPVTQVQMTSKYWQGLRLLLADKQWILFMSIALIQGMSLSITLNFLFLHLEDMGASKTLMGLSLTFATLSEFPLWFYADRLLNRWGMRKVLTFSLLMYAVRAFGYALMTQPWMVLPLSLLHGPSFAAMWAAGVSYVANKAPKGLGATAQGLFSSTTFGLGGMLGGFVGGLLYDSLGGVRLFQIVGMLLLLVWAIFSIAGRKSLA